MIEKNIFIEKQDGKKIFVNIFEKDKKAPNVIYIQTPIASVVELKECYYHLSKYGLNVFALDLSGIGKSEGAVKDFDIKTIGEDIDACVEYIKREYNDVIHLFGGTGTGGILAQHYISGDNSLKSFAQFGLAIHKDISPMINPIVGKAIYLVTPVIKKVIPNLNIKMKPNKFSGKNADKENQWYKEVTKKGIMDINISVLHTLLKIFISDTSNLKEKPSCPVLVFAPKHDRYFPMSYMEKYYNWLKEPKKIHVIDDAHLSFIWHSEEICEAASKWFLQHSGND
ncbi:Lysophospholipase, alpha-beta hydrolase superfamily [Natronincola peptidivorans]|uniref:Lysophospholipase, alpha-beta hydrolase superfamily n=1 Tax=Natronincola peptidivorans TaxID=426128 RepID=A0A1I0FSA3_9FIRM|nr:alpha/beta hydrolase [Natronincola peptidivorans]SET61197.1 Lysophospholipase, alpha-beta hydrolase superfamily [Natronincola peptidivorans]